MMGGEVRKAGCLGPYSGALGRHSQEGKGELKTEGKERGLW